MSQPGPPYEVGQVVNGYRWDGHNWVRAESELTPPASPVGYSSPQTPPSAPMPVAGASSDPSNPYATPATPPSAPGMGYGQSSTNYGAPSYGAPSYGTPSYGAPSGQGSGGWTDKKIAGAVGIGFGLVVVLVIGLVLFTRGNDPGPNPTVAVPTTIADPTPTDTGNAGGGGGGGNYTGSVSEEAKAKIDQAFGTFTAVEKSGSGDSTISMPGGVSAALVTIDGGSSALVTAKDSEGRLAGIVTTYSDGKVTDMVNSFSGKDIANLEVKASGSWKITLSPVSSAPAVPLPGQIGKGIYIYDGPATTLNVDAPGEGYVNVNFRPVTSDKFPDKLTGEGPYKGSISVNESPIIVDVYVRDTLNISQ